MVLSFGLLSSNLFPNSEALGEGMNNAGVIIVEDEAGNRVTVLSEDSTKKWSLILG